MVSSMAVGALRNRGLTADIESWVHNTFDDVIPNGTDLRVNCPFCPEPDTGHHLYISMVHDTCHCFRCDYAASHLGLIAAVEECSVSEAASHVGWGVTPLWKLLGPRGEKQGKIELPGMFCMPDCHEYAKGMPNSFVTIDYAIVGGLQYLNDSAMRVLNYITDRFDGKYGRAEVGRRFGEWWGIWKDVTANKRLVIPVENGWWTSRLLPREYGPKYLSCRKPKGNILYNYLALEKYSRVAIAEGAFSAEFIGDWAVALCGKKATPEQLERLAASSVEEFEICLDGGTWDETDRLAGELLRRGKRVDVRMYSCGEDPASSTLYDLHPYNTETSVRLKWRML